LLRAKNSGTGDGGFM